MSGWLSDSRARVAPLLLSGGLVAAAAWSLTWSMAIDLPVMAYAALLIDRFGYVPYRDIVDFNPPGTYLAYVGLGRLFGYTEIGFRLADLACLAVLFGLTTRILHRFGGHAAFAGPVLFGFVYFGSGPSMSLQREYLLLLPTAGATLAAMSGANPFIRASIVGLLIGAATTIKPQILIMLPALASFLILDAGERCGTVRRRVTGIVAAIAAGLTLPVSATAIYLWFNGGLSAFLEIAREYWPLYNSLTGDRPHRIVGGVARIRYLAEGFLLERNISHLLVVPAIAGVWIAWRRANLSSATRRQIGLLAALAAAGQLYALAGGKFWNYHWLPSLYFAALLSSLVFVKIDRRRPLPVDVLPALILVMALAVSPLPARVIHHARADLVIPPHATAYRIADALRTRLQPGDLVQPLDWTGGAAHALLLTNTRMATPFLYDFYFYHHVSDPYTTAMRGRFIAAMLAARPRFIVQADRGSRRLVGAETTTRFDALSDLLAREYRVVIEDPQFALYERIASPDGRHGSEEESK